MNELREMARKLLSDLAIHLGELHGVEPQKQKINGVEERMERELTEAKNKTALAISSALP